MKFHVLYQFKEGPYGGGNQFLKALRGELRQRQQYAETVEQANAVIANANPDAIPFLLRVLPRIRKTQTSVPVIIRIDGPIRLVRGRDGTIDRMLSRLIRLYADGVIFQSRWSQKANEKLGIAASFETVIHNAPDSQVFFTANQKPPSSRIRLIATSWSPNWQKGFSVYSYLDKNLDWSRYEMTFIGNSPAQFNNITIIPPVPSTKLADMLRQHHIYITASENDPCSNALLEALACGLPVVARNSGGHPELIKNGGVVFNDYSDIVPAIEQVAANLSLYKSQLPQYSIKSVARQYHAFAEKVHAEIKQARSSKKIQALFLTFVYRVYQLKKTLLKARPKSMVGDTR